MNCYWMKNILHIVCVSFIIRGLATITEHRTFPHKPQWVHVLEMDEQLLIFNYLDCFVSGNLPYLESQQKGIFRDSLSSPKTGNKDHGENGNTSEGLVMFNGAMVDITSVMQHLEKSEKTRTALECKYKEIQDEMGRWRKLIGILQQFTYSLL